MLCKPNTSSDLSAASPTRRCRWWLWLATGQEGYRLLYKFWLKLFAVSFGMRVVSAIVLYISIRFSLTVSTSKNNGKLRFHRLNAPTASELNTLVATLSQRVARHLERQGLLARDNESSYLTLDLQGDDAMNQFQGHSITYRIAVGPQQGRKVFTLQTIPSWAALAHPCASRHRDVLSIGR